MRAKKSVDLCLLSYCSKFAPKAGILDQQLSENNKNSEQVRRSDPGS